MNNIIIRAAQLSDVDDLIRLNNKYLLNHLTEEQKQKGFVRVEYEREYLQQIITNKEIVVALDYDLVIGYYLIGRTSNNDRLVYQREKLLLIFNDEKKIEKIGYGAQAVIEKEYRGNNLLQLMLNELIKQLNGKYEILFSSVTKINNSALKAHTAGGYKVLAEDDDKFYVGLKLF